MNILEEWPTEKMVESALDNLPNVNREDVVFALKGALAVAPTPPAQEDEPIGFTSHHMINGLKAGKRLREWVLPEKDDIDFPDTNIPLYTRPADDKLRKAAEEMLQVIDRWIDTDEIVLNIPEAIKIGDLRAVLEGK